MADPFKIPGPGDPFVPLIEHTQWLIESRTRGDKARDPRGRRGELDAGVIYVKNETGGDLDGPHPIVGLGDPLFTPADRDDVVFERPLFSGISPSTDGRFAVLFGPVPAGDIILAVTSGTVWVRVDVVDGDHSHCTVDGDPTALVSASSGSGYMIWRAGGLGVQWAYVRLSNPGGVGEELPPTSGSGSGSGDACKINGVPTSSIPVATADSIDYVLGVNSDGCLVRVTVGDCAEGGGSGS